VDSPHSVIIVVFFVMVLSPGLETLGRGGRQIGILSLSSERFCDMVTLLKLCYREMTSKISGKCMYQSVLS